MTANRIIKTSVLAVWLAAGASHAAPAPQEVADKLKALLPGTAITAVETTALDGLYEVTAGGNIFYMQPDKPLLVVGHVFDLKTTEDITQPKLDQLQAAKYGVKWDELPLAARISVGDAKAVKEVVAFLDVDCPYCQQAHRLLQAAKGIRVHYVMLPLDSLHPEAREKTLNILCADDPVAALNQGMAGSPVPKTGSDECRASNSTALDEAAHYATAHQIAGTPFFVTNDGLVMAGLGDKLTHWLQGSKQP